MGGVQWGLIRVRVDVKGDDRARKEHYIVMYVYAERTLCTMHTLNPCSRSWLKWCVMYDSIP